jgi:hypothetical protein
LRWNDKRDAAEPTRLWTSFKNPAMKCNHAFNFHVKAKQPVYIRRFLMKPHFFACMTLGASSLAAVDTQAVPILQAYALSAGGDAQFGSLGDPFSCTTFGPDPLAQGIGAGFEVILPISGPCGVGGDSRAASTTTGGVSVASTLAVGFGRSPDLKAFIGESTGRAGFGSLGARASASFSGSTTAATVAGAQAFGKQTDTLTFIGGTGAGVFRPTFTIDGSLFNVGRTESQIAFSYAVGSGPTFLGFRIQNSRGTVGLYGPNGFVPSFPGIATTGDLVNGLTTAGSTTFTLDIPIDYGLPADITYNLWAAAIPGSSVGLLFPSAGEVEFFTSATLTGIELLDANRRTLDAFTITAASGTHYDRNGVVRDAVIGVPAPGTLSLLALGLWAAGLRMRQCSA